MNAEHKKKLAEIFSTILPVTDEVIQMSKILGYLPKEYLDPYVDFLEQAIKESHEKNLEAMSELGMADCIVFRNLIFAAEGYRSTKVLFSK